MLFTDASKHCSSLEVLQAPFAEVKEQLVLKFFTPKPLLFLSGKFSASKVSWDISHKEPYLIVHAQSRLAWLLLGHPSPIYAYRDLLVRNQSALPRRDERKNEVVLADENLSV